MNTEPGKVNQVLENDLSEILISSEQIKYRVNELGKAISQDYSGKTPLMIGVLKGVLIFMADLLRAISIPLEVDFMAVTSYSPETRARGVVRLIKDLEIPISGRDVLFVEDVVDTGLTLNYLLHTLKSQHPASLEVCVLFNKSKHRLIDIPLKYKGFDLPDRFVVGYGLDYREHYRNLPFVALLKPEIFQSGK
jgi:hypoxanthine phosphoribosyltransferase